jgi:hypothetical protein
LVSFGGSLYAAGNVQTRVEASGNFTVTSSIGKLTPPSRLISQAPEEIVGESIAGGTISLLSNITPRPEAQFTWQLDARPLLTDGEQADGSIIQGATTPTLQLQNIQPGDYWVSFGYATATGCRDSMSFRFVVRPVCDSVDFNNDGLSPDDADIFDFLSVLAGGPCSNDPNCNDIDFNNDGLFPDDNDLISFLSVLAGGAC